jgi:hypothetical protein
VEVSGQFHTLAALPSVKETLVPIGQEAADVNHHEMEQIMFHRTFNTKNYMC